VRIVHAADVHLDSPLLGLERYEGAPVEEARSATRRAFTRLVDLCLEQDACLLLLAGDLFDGEWKDYQSGLFLAKELRRLGETRTRVLLVHGNHDAARGGISSRLPLPEHVTRFDARHPETCVLEELGLAVHGQSYGRPDVAEDLAAGYPAPLKGMLNIGLLHTNVGGVPEHGNYAPCRLEDLAAKGYDYWALGHVHQRQVLREHPWVAYSGCTQGRHAKETGAKGCLVLEASDAGIESVEFAETDVMRWAQVRAEAAEEDRSLEDVLARVEAALASAAREADGRLVGARVTLIGTCEAHALLARDPDAFDAGVRSLDLEGTWIEKTALGTRPLVDLAALRESGGALGALLQEIERLRVGRETTTLASGVEDFWAKVRPALGEGEGGFDLASPETLLDLLDSAEGLLVGLLQEEASRA
jgi:DNA repair protein SbcD/Mre11